MRRQLANDSSCGLCDWLVESVLHIFRDCERARSVRHALSIHGLVSHFLSRISYLGLLLIFFLKLIEVVVCLGQLCLFYLLVPVEMEE